MYATSFYFSLSLAYNFFFFLILFLSLNGGGGVVLVWCWWVGWVVMVVVECMQLFMPNQHRTHFIPIILFSLSMSYHSTVIRSLSSSLTLYFILVYSCKSDCGFMPFSLPGPPVSHLSDPSPLHLQLVH